MNKLKKEWNAVLTIAGRGILNTLNSPVLIIMSLVMPVMMMGMLGGMLRQNMAEGLNFYYGSFMLVGMIVNMLFMMTMMGLTGLVEDRQTNFTQEMMISPISRVSIIIGTILGSSFQATVSTIGTFAVGLFMGIILSWWQILLILVLSPLICLAAGSLAMIIIGSISNTKTANIAVSILVFPQMFLCGALIPIAKSSGILWLISRLLPMTYCLDLVRGVVYAGTAEYSGVVLHNPMINLLVIGILTAAFLTVGTYAFTRNETHK
jgi:ABC-2 type transport system permease protein